MGSRHTHKELAPGLIVQFREIELGEYHGSGTLSLEAIHRFHQEIAVGPVWFAVRAR